jgi:tetratricopeptide (TPR) repeat protein
VQAAGLTAAELDRATLLDRAGEMAYRAANQDAAVELSERARELFEAAGRQNAAARSLVRIAIVESNRGQLPQSIERLERAYEVLVAEGPSDELARLAARLSSAYYFSGDVDRSAELVDRALDMAEAQGYPEALMNGWVSKAMLCASGRRPEEARALFQIALELAMRHGVNDVASRCAGNLSDLAFRRDRYAEALAHLDQARELARAVGVRPFEWFAISESTYALFMLGRWDEALAAYADLPEEQLATSGTLLSPLTSVLEIHAHRGDLAAARRLYARYEPMEHSGSVQDMACFAAALACLLVCEGRHGEALAAHERAIEHAHTLGADGQDVKMAVTWAIQAVVALDDREYARSVLEWVEAIPPGLRPPSLTGHAHRLRAWLEPDAEAAAEERAAAVEVFRRLGLPFWLAVALLEQVEAGVGPAGPLLAEANATFEALGAGPWVERTRLAGLTAGAAAVGSAGEPA